MHMHFSHRLTRESRLIQFSPQGPENAPAPGRNIFNTNPEELAKKSSVVDQQTREALQNGNFRDLDRTVGDLSKRMGEGLKKLYAALAIPDLEEMEKENKQRQSSVRFENGTALPTGVREAAGADVPRALAQLLDVQQDQISRMPEKRQQELRQQLVGNAKIGVATDNSLVFCTATDAGGALQTLRNSNTDPAIILSPANRRQLREQVGEWKPEDLTRANDKQALDWAQTVSPDLNSMDRVKTVFGSSVTILRDPRNQIHLQNADTTLTGLSATSTISSAEMMARPSTPGIIKTRVEIIRKGS